MGFGFSLNFLLSSTASQCSFLVLLPHWTVAESLSCFAVDFLVPAGVVSSAGALASSTLTRVVVCHRTTISHQLSASGCPVWPGCRSKQTCLKWQQLELHHGPSPISQSPCWRILAWHDWQCRRLFQLWMKPSLRKYSYL